MIINSVDGSHPSEQGQFGNQEQEEELILNVHPPVEVHDNLSHIVNESAPNPDLMDNDQKNLVNFMDSNPFKSTPNAEDVDPDMLINLGGVVSKNRISTENNIHKYNVKYENGTLYEGQIVESSADPNYEQPTQYGKFEFPNGDVYSGEIGIRGKGKYTHHNGVEYTGQFFKLGKSGYGEETFPNGDWYKGMFKRNLKNGKGVINYENGDVFVGCFEDGMRRHIGTYTFKSGEKVEGDWKEDMLEGKAQYDFQNGQTVKSSFSGSQLKL